jgi:2-dehydro-3-deoxygluconokinase
MIAGWKAEGIGTAGTVRLPGKLPGLYFIRTDGSGERRFFYYRTEAAVRSLFRVPETDALLAALPGYDALYFSGITLAVLAPDARQRFLRALMDARQRGRTVAFDSNFRPALWPDRAAAHEVLRDFLPVVSLALPTFDDEQALFGDADPAATLERYGSAGVPEIVVKRGAQPCLVMVAGMLGEVAVPAPIVPIDTTAAGDAFNAGYLAARLTGGAAERAALAGHGLAGAVIRHHGAIIPRSATPSLKELP